MTSIVPFVEELESVMLRRLSSDDAEVTKPELIPIPYLELFVPIIDQASGTQDQNAQFPKLFRNLSSDFLSRVFRCFCKCGEKGDATNCQSKILVKERLRRM